MPRKEIIAKRRAEGKCTECGKFNTQGASYCELCKKEVRKRVAKYKKKLIKENRCRECARPLPDDGMNNTVTCPACTMRPRFDKLFK